MSYEQCLGTDLNNLPNYFSIYFQMFLEMASCVEFPTLIKTVDMVGFSS